MTHPLIARVQKAIAEAEAIKPPPGTGCKKVSRVRLNGSTAYYHCILSPRHGGPCMVERTPFKLSQKGGPRR